MSGEEGGGGVWSEGQHELEGYRQMLEGASMTKSRMVEENNRKETNKRTIGKDISMGATKESWFLQGLNRVH